MFFAFAVSISYCLFYVSQWDHWINVNDKITPQMCYIFRIYYTFALFLALFGVDVFVFERFRLNYIFIFDIPPNKIVAGYRTMFRRAFTFIIIVGFCATMSITSSILQNDADIDHRFPLIPLPFSNYLE